MKVKYKSPLDKLGDTTDAEVGMKGFINRMVALAVIAATGMWGAGVALSYLRLHPGGDLWFFSLFIAEVLPGSYLAARWLTLTKN